MNTEFINKAIAFATKAHKNQFRKGSETPYIFHPLEVGAIAAGLTDDENVIVAAILHDTVEDTDVTKWDIAREFGETVTYLVMNESEDKKADRPPANTWKERKQETIDLLSRCDDDRVKIIALSDKLSNIRAMQRDYRKVGDRLWDRFNQHDPKEHKWYYYSFIDTLKSLENTQAYNEYKYLVQKVFENY